MIILKLTENAIILSAGIVYFEAPRLSPEILVRTFSMYTYSEVGLSRSIFALWYRKFKLLNGTRMESAGKRV